MRRLKVLFPFVGDSIGGSHLSSVELFKAIKLIVVDPIILLHENDGSLSKFLDKEGIVYQFIPSNCLAGSSPGIFSIAIGMIKNVVKFRRFLIGENIDIVHGNDLRINLSWSLPAKLAGIKFVWHQRTLLSSSYLWRFIPYLCHCFIVISRKVLDGAPSNIGDDKIKLIFNPVAVKAYSKSNERNLLCRVYSIPSNRLLIGYVGRLVYYKRLDFMIDGLALFKSKYDIQFHFVIMGAGEGGFVERLRKKVKLNKMNDCVTFTGFVNDSSKMIASLDVLVAASRIDAFGRSIVEAMLQQVPVLVSAAGGHQEVVQDGITGYMFDAEDHDDFMSKLYHLTFDDKQSLVKKAYLQAKDKYSVEKHASSVKSVYLGLFQ